MNSEKVIESKEQLVEWFKLGNKNKKDWKVGTEHEKFAYNFSKQKNIFTPADYESLNGIESFLNEISTNKTGLLNLIATFEAISISLPLEITSKYKKST